MLVTRLSRDGFQTCLVIGLTCSALCLTTAVDQTRLIADRPKPQKHSSWDHQRPAQHGAGKHNGGRKQPASSAVPPYAVKMEPVAHYSQQDPLYPSAAANISAKIDYGVTSYGGAQADAPYFDASYGAADDGSYGAPQYHQTGHQSYYGKEPEPIIEIIIKESNESLPAPPPPPPPPPAPAKEPVQVFYVKYKKNPNAYGGKDDIVYEKPVPAITPHAGPEAAAGAGETTYPAASAGPPPPPPPQPAYSGGGYATAPPPPPPPPQPAYNGAGYATAPPAPSTTYRTIIKPDSEVYHGTGLKVTFGKPETSWGQLNEAQKRDSVADATDVRGSKADGKPADREFKRSFVQPSPPPSNVYATDGFGAPRPTLVAAGQPPHGVANGFGAPKSDFPAQQHPRKPDQPLQAQGFFREDGPRPNFQAQVPIVGPHVQPQQPNRFDNFRNPQNQPPFNGQPNFQHLNNQPNHQQFASPPNHQQFTNQQNHQQLNSQQNHQQLNKQQNHQQFNNQQNPQQFNNQQNHQHFNNHQHPANQQAHQQPGNQHRHQQQLNNQQGHQQFVNQQRPLDFQASSPVRSPANLPERPAPIKFNNERPLITQPFENIALQSKPFESRLPQDRPFDNRPFESRPAPERSLENRPAFDRPFDNRPGALNGPAFDDRRNQPTVNYRPNKPPTPQNIPLNPNPPFVPSDKRPTVPPPPLPSNYNTQPLGLTKHTVDLAFSPQQQQQQHQQFQKQQFQQQQILQQYRNAETRPALSNNINYSPAASFVQQQQQQPTRSQQFTPAEAKPPTISQYHQQQQSAAAKQQQQQQQQQSGAIRQQQQQSFFSEAKPSQTPQLQITPSNSYKLEPAQSGQFFETYAPTRAEHTTSSSFRFDNSPWQVSNGPSQSAFHQPRQEHREHHTTTAASSISSSSSIGSSSSSATRATTAADAYRTTDRPALSYVTSPQRERVVAPSAGPAGSNATAAPDPKNVAALPDEVPDELREQLLSSGILSNADIQILDYDKVGDIPIESLPPEALENLYGQGSDPVPSIALPPSRSDVRMKVVKYDPDTAEGRRIEGAYVDRPRAQTLPPVVLNDTAGYNRFLPLNIDGTHFPIPDSPLLKNKAIASVVILSPVGYDVSDDDQSRPSRNAAVKVKGVHFVVGDVVKSLVREPNRRNFEAWLETEKNTPSEEQSVVLLVAKPNGKTDGKEIYMYDVTHNQVNKLSGELSATFVDVAESNSKSNDLDNLSSEEEVDVVMSGNSTNDNTPVVSGYSKTNDDFSSSIVATANN